MCELFCMSSRLPTVATFTLDRFAARGGLDGRTIDGWGLAFYDGTDLRLYREPEPARDSLWLQYVGRRHLPARILLDFLQDRGRSNQSLNSTHRLVLLELVEFPGLGKIDLGYDHRCGLINGWLDKMEPPAQDASGKHKKRDQPPAMVSACKCLNWRKLFHKVMVTKRDILPGWLYSPDYR